MKQQPSTYPLCWPPSVKRAKTRVTGKFSRTETAAIDAIRANLDRMQAGNPLVSTNKLRFESKAYATSNHDPGVALYFTYKSQERVIAIDRYASTCDNLCAIANTLDSLRTIERHGGIDVFEQALKGFDVAELPAPKRPWHEVLRVYPDAPLGVIEAAYRDQAKVVHPDVPTGSTVAFQTLSEAYKEAKAERAGKQG